VRSYKTVIQGAELLALPPQEVAVFLKKRAEQFKAGFFWDDPIDGEAEVALRSRSNPLIDLALARYACDSGTVIPMFEVAPPCSAIRLAILSNRNLGGILDKLRFPDVIFGGSEKLAAWLAEAPVPELQALFENPKIDDRFLRDLLERSKPWDEVHHERLAIIVAILSNNERLQTPYGGGYMDPSRELDYAKVFDAAWKLSQTVEPSQQWAAILSRLYDRLETGTVFIEETLAVAARWRPDPSNAELANKEAQGNDRGWLSDHQDVRKGLARLALDKNSKLLTELLASDDPALRCAAYASGELTPEQLSAAYERDGELAYNYAVRNLWLWRTSKGRAELREVAWAVTRKESDLIAANVYNGMRKDMATKHPDWFNDEKKCQSEFDASKEVATKADIVALAARLGQQGAQGDKGIDPSEAPATKADIAALTERLDWLGARTDIEMDASVEPASKADIVALGERMGQQGAHTVTIIEQLKKLTVRVGWPFWFAVGILAVGLSRHF
jgi:hypothetical protein